MHSNNKFKQKRTYICETYSNSRNKLFTSFNILSKNIPFQACLSKTLCKLCVIPNKPKAGSHLPGFGIMHSTFMGSMGTRATFIPKAKQNQPFHSTVNYANTHLDVQIHAPIRMTKFDHLFATKTRTRSKRGQCDPTLIAGYLAGYKSQGYCFLYFFYFNYG